MRSMPFGPKAREGHEDIRALLNAGYRRSATAAALGRIMEPERLAE